MKWWYIYPIYFKGEKIESKDVKNVVKNLGIELASEELEKLMKTLPTDGEPYKCLWGLPGSLNFCGFVLKF